MGIPSYYRTLCSSVPGLLQKRLPKETTVGTFWIDFNCIVYHCIRKPGMPAYPGDEGRKDWETQLIRTVCSYVQDLVGLVKPTEKVYIAIDGVVPMAKMRQQRKRRFKSHWVHQKELSLGKPNEPRWDSNSITPGTEFMENLSVALKAICKPGWIVSDASEPGEGEQKLFHEIRSKSWKGSMVVYGLDADLIVLSLLQQVNQSNDLWLFREHTELGGGVVYQDGVEEYRFLCIPKLVSVLANGDSNVKGYITDYCAVMMLLGNDFLPHSLWFTIRDGGHGELVSLLGAVRKVAGSLIHEKRWNPEPLGALLLRLAASEEAGMSAMIMKKQKLQPRRSQDLHEAWEQEIERWNYTPLIEKDEKRLLDSQGVLSRDWMKTYNEAYLASYSPQDLEIRVRTYLEGLDWSLQYATGWSEVSWTWMYPWSYPPLWSDIVKGLGQLGVPRPDPVNLKVKPQEQLAMVLPLESWWLVRDPVLRMAPAVFPHLWKFELGFCTAGKRMMWECDPSVPLIPVERMRFLQKKAAETKTRWGKVSLKDLIQHMSESIQIS